MPHVFISYVRQNQPQVDRLVRDLRLAGLEIWLDRDSLAAGANWTDAIERAIRSGAAFVACFSKDYLRREHTYMDEELHVARALLLTGGAERSWLIPTILDDCSPNDVGILNEAVLAQLHCVSMAPDWQDGLRRILAVLSPERAMGRRLNRLPSKHVSIVPELPLLSLDFGTSNSLLAWRLGSTWHPIVDPDGRSLHPSVVTFADNWDYWVGSEAVEASAVRPTRSVHNIKRLLGRGTEVRIDHKLFDAVTLAALMIRYLRDCAESHFGRRVEEVITAIPSGYSLAQSTRLVQACELAGLVVTRVIPEPNAAGIVSFHCIRSRRELLNTPKRANELPDACILVIDMGGGTTDVSLEEVADVDGEWQVEVLASSGDNELGGMDYDAAISDWLKNKFVAPLLLSGLCWTPQDDRRLTMLARQCKEVLSQREVFEATLHDVEVEPGRLETLSLPITRTEMTEAVRLLDDRLLKHVESVMHVFDSLGSKSTRPIAAIILGGQGARSWSVANLLRSRFSRTEIVANYQENAVSQGLATYANVLEGKRKNLLLLDAVIHGIGIRCRSTAATDKGHLICEIDLRPSHNSQIETLLAPGSLKPLYIVVLLRPLTAGTCPIEVVELDRGLTAVGTLVTFEPVVVESASVLELEIDIDANGSTGIRLRNRDAREVLGQQVHSLCSSRRAFAFRGGWETDSFYKEFNR